MKLINLFLTFIFLLVLSCGQEAEEAGAGLYIDHQKVDNEFSITLPSDGTYGEGQNLDVVITHPGVLSVDGGPYISLTVGEDVYNASYLSGSGSKSLTFRYTIQAGDEDINGVELASAINLNGGSVQFASSGVLSNAPTVLDGIPTSEIRVDTSAPVIIGNTPPIPGTYTESDTLFFVMTYDTQVVVTGTPRISLNIGGVTRYANYLGGSGSSTIFFTYTVQAADTDNDGIVQNSPLELNGGTIKDVGNNNASLTFVAGDTSLVNVNGAAPFVQSVTKPTAQTYFNGNTISFSLVFNETVTVASGTPSVDITIGSTTKSAGYISGSGSNTLVFQYLVVNPDLDNNGIAINNIITLNGATIRNGSSVDSVLLLPIPLTPSVLVYGIFPSIVSVTAPTDNDYITASVLDFSVLFSEDILVTNTPRLAIDIGGSVKYANYISGSGTSSLVFRYTVGAPDNDNDGITFNSTTVDLNTTGTIKSEYSSSNAGLSFSGLEPTMTNVTVNQTPATQLVYTQEPTDVFVDTNISPAITVEIRDGSNNLVTSATDNVTISINNDAAGGTTLAGTLTVAAVAGIATFSDIQLNKIASGFTLDVDSGSLTTDTSVAFDVIASNATKVGFFVEPSNTVAGSNVAAAIQVRILDVSDNVVTAATNNITIAFGTDPSAASATLSGTLTVAAVAGVATFSDINIDKAFTGYTLTATSAGLTDDTSASFDITAATKAKLAFSVEPSNAEVDTVVAPSIKIEIQDTYGNKTADTDSITLVINNDPPTGTTLGGTLSVAAVAGEATFSDIDLNKVGVGFTLDATAGGLTTATSSAFDITTTPTQLVITQEPADVYANFAIAPAITVEIRDGSNNLVTSATDNITVAFSANPGPGTLGGTLTVAAVAGIATFSDLEVDTVANAYSLNFTSGALTNDISDTFDVTAAPATKLAFNVQPSNTQAGQGISPSITVEIQDAASNVVTTATDNVTLAFGTDASSGAATLGGTLTVAAVAGIATFSGINIDKAFTGYTLNATSGALTLATSTTFDITPYTAVKLGYKVEPVDTTDAAVISPSIEVSILDTYDNIVTSASVTITLAFANDASSGSATLGGTLAKATSSGVATFDNITVNYPATGYTLQATGGAYTASTSAAFTIFGTPAKLGFSTQPADTQLGNNIPNIIVNILDAADNIVGSATNSVTLALSADPSSGSATLSGTLSVAAVAGVATFSGLSLDEAYADYTLVATSGALTSITSNPFDITLAPPTSLTLITPTVRVAGVANGDVVKVYTDASCTIEVASYSSSGITIDITTSALAEGAHTLYAKRTSSGGTPSTCSTANLAYEVSGSFYQIDVITNSDFGNWSNAGGDDGDWSTDTNDTASTDVGPTAPKSGTHYAFTEASSPVAVNDEFILESNTLDGSTNDLAFNFYWNKRGDNMGDLYFEASNNGGSTWTTLWSHTGADVATAGSDVWRNQWVDLCDASYTASNVKLRLRAVMPASGNVWNSDVGIDELEVTSGGCLPGVPSTIAITTPTASTIAGVINMASFEVSGTCSDNGQNVTLSGDVSGSTSCALNIWSITLDLSAHADGNVVINADHTATSGGPNGTDTVTIVKDALNIQFDDLETLGNWTQDSTNDDHDWTLNSGDTTSSGVGPSDDQSGGGKYAYTEASSPVATTEEFILISNSLDAGTYNLNFQFYWNKRGDSMGDLYVEVSTDGGTTWDTASWSHLGVDVAKDATDVWNSQAVDLCNAGYNSGNIKVRIRAVMPSSGNVWNSDIAVDSLKFTNDGCP